MCGQCNYSELLESAGIEPSQNRLHILEVIGDNAYPLTAAEIYHAIDSTQPINRVTVYRVLDLLLQNNLIERLSTGGRTAHYGMAPSKHHVRHPHFYCTVCGQMDCLSPESIEVEMENLEKTFAGKVDRVEIRVDGVCRNCLKKEKRVKKE